MSHQNHLKSAIHHIIPYDFKDIFGLVGRLMREKHGAGRMGMVYSALGIAASPLDWIFRINENKLLKGPFPKNHPIVFVIGAPRSGTTLTAQVLIKNLPIKYFNNLTSIFPQSPISALKTFGWMMDQEKRRIRYSSLYGRTVWPSEPNDALYFWDRWMDKNRKLIPESFTLKQKEDIQNFYGACLNHFQMPLIQKVNRMNTFAHLVAEVLENAYFICLDRNPIFHAQSLLIARNFIHGNMKHPYGIQGDKASDLLDCDDPVESVCAQVLFHKKIAQQQLKRIGSDRFMIVPYESFCSKPSQWVQSIGNNFLGLKSGDVGLGKEIVPFKQSARLKIKKELFWQIIKSFQERVNEVNLGKNDIREAELAMK